MIPFISNLFKLPVTRKEVLQRAKKHQDFGLCYAIDTAFVEYHLVSDYLYLNLEMEFPKFTPTNAQKFGGLGTQVKSYWWKPKVWNTGRMDFLNWLIEEYKDDKTNLRKL